MDVSAGGMTFDNMGTGDFPLYAPIIMLVLDIFLYFILAVYLDHVIPGKKILFCCDLIALFLTSFIDPVSVIWIYIMGCVDVSG